MRQPQPSPGPAVPALPLAALQALSPSAATLRWPASQVRSGNPGGMLSHVHVVHGPWASAADSVATSSISASTSLFPPRAVTATACASNGGTATSRAQAASSATAVAVANATASSYGIALGALQACAASQRPAQREPGPDPRTIQFPCFGYVAQSCCQPPRPQRCLCSGTQCAYVKVADRPAIYAVSGTGGTPLLASACRCA